MQSLNSGLKVRCGPTAEIPFRKQEMTSAAMQQLCQGEKGRVRRKEGAERGGGGLRLSSINTIVLCLIEAKLICSPLTNIPSLSSLQ